MLFRSVNGPNLGAMVVAIHTAMNPLMTKMRYPSHELVGSFKMIDNAIKTAISNFQADHPAKQSNCFPTLKQSDKNRKYLQLGYKPADPAHAICINCSHSFVDEPNSNLSLQSDHEKALREYEKKKKDAKEDAEKNKTTAKRIPAPKLIQPYQQCHCSQMFCLNIGSTVGTSCPIKCKNPETGNSYGTTNDGSCACPICKCTCSIAYTTSASQIICTRQLLNNNSIQQQKLIEEQTS